MQVVSRDEEASSFGRRYCDNRKSPVTTECQLGVESSNMSSDDHISTFDEFSHYVESAFGACEGNNAQSHEEDSKSSTFWELMITMYLPFCVMWLKQSVFGVTLLFRTVILGHLLRLVFGNLSEWMNEKTPWLHAFLQPMGPHSKPDTKAWPPPALFALTFFTVVTLVVHPDGYTWVALGKVK